MASHQEPHVHTFTFGQEEQARLKRNVPPKVGNRWNALYFMLRAILRKRSGKAATIPARPMPDAPPDFLLARLKERARQAMRDAWSRIGAEYGG